MDPEEDDALVRRANDMIQMFKRNTAYQQPEPRVRTPPREEPPQFLRVRSEENGGSSPGGSSTASGATATGCLGFDLVEEKGSRLGSSLGSSKSETPALEVSVYRSSSPLHSMGFGKSNSDPELFDVHSPGPPLFMSRPGSCFGHDEPALLHTRLGSPVRAHPPGGFLGQKRPREEPPAPFACMALERPSTVIEDELPFAADLMGNVGFEFSMPGPKQPTSKPSSSSMPYTMNGRPNAAQNVTGGGEVSVAKKPNPYAFASPRFTPTPSNPAPNAKTPLSLGSAAARNVSGMKYVVPPSVIPIPPKAPSSKPIKRQTAPVVTTAPNGWRDAPGSHMLGKSLPKLGDSELTRGVPLTNTALNRRRMTKPGLGR